MGKAINALKQFIEDVRDGKVSPYVVFYDLETTGVKKDHRRIVQFASIVTKFDPVTMRFVEAGESFDTLVNPGIMVDGELYPIEMPREASDVNGITDEMLQSEATFDAYSDRIFGMMQGRSVGGYNNISFDDKVMLEYGNEFGRLFMPNASIDVMLLAEECLTSNEVGRFTLANVFEHLFPGHKVKFHDASEDIRATFEVANEIIRKYVLVGKKHCKPVSAKYWEMVFGGGSRRDLKRVYVTTDVGKFYFDVVRNAWGIEKESLETLVEVGQWEMTELEQWIMDATCTASMREAAKVMKEKNLSLKAEK